MLAAFQTKVAEQAAAEAVSTLTGTVIGALLVLAVGVAIWAVWRLNKVQSERVEDKDKMVGELSKAQNNAVELTKELLERFNHNAAAMGKLSDSVRDQGAAVRELSNKVERLDRTVELSSRAGLSSRYSRSTTPPRTPSAGGNG